MIEIGPNLAGVLLAIVGIVASIVAAYRAEQAHGRINRADEGIAWNARRVRQLERRSGLKPGDDGGT